MRTSPTGSKYLVGTLVVDIFNGKSKSLIWRGIAQDELSEKAEKNTKKRAKAMEKLFKEFPPGSVQKKKWSPTSRAGRSLSAGGESARVGPIAAAGSRPSPLETTHSMARWPRSASRGFRAPRFP